MEHAASRPSHIMIVDDEAAIRTIFEIHLKKNGYLVDAVATADEALRRLARQPCDVLITDIAMPGRDGISLLQEVRARFDVDIMVMTGNAGEYTYDAVVDLGACDFMHKPVSLNELLVRVKRVLRERSLLQGYQQQHLELKHAYLDTVNRLALAAEYKDEDTADHLMRISRYSALVARGMGLPAAEVENIGYAAPMHDIGKIGIPDSILQKKGRLTRDEFTIVQSHTTIGAAILADSRSEILRIAHDTALSHHERWDGTGYPRGLAGQQIPLPGRIVCIADVFDALTMSRPYKDPYPLDVALTIIEHERGRQFDPDVTDVFVAHIDAIVEIHREISPAAVGSGGRIGWSDRDRDDYAALFPQAGAKD